MVELRLQRVMVHYINVGMQCGRSRSITNISTVRINYLTLFLKPCVITTGRHILSFTFIIPYGHRGLRKERRIPWVKYFPGQYLQLNSLSSAAENPVVFRDFKTQVRKYLITGANARLISWFNNHSPKWRWIVIIIIIIIVVILLLLLLLLLLQLLLL